MENNFENLTIGVFAKAAGVNVETIRFYQRKGLLPEPDKPYGSIRRYGEADVTRVRFVKSAQRLGFSLDEIAELLRLEDGTHCEEASGLAEHKLKDVREKMADLARMEAVLSELVCACHTRKGTVAKLAMRQPFVLFKGLTFQKLCLPGAFRPGDHHNKMLRPGLCVVHASPQYL
ncbi:Hg(II)-responsive transcriptional regulator [Acinetobacter baumannii]